MGCGDRATKLFGQPNSNFIGGISYPLMVHFSYRDENRELVATAIAAVALQLFRDIDGHEGVLE